MRVAGTTRVAAVIGDPISHSRSPSLHNAAFDACGLDWVYVAFTVTGDGVPAALEAMRALGIAGYSVTMPGKEAAARDADETTPIVDALGAANCITNIDGHLVADNTDGAGFVEGLADDAGFGLEGRHLVLFGAGGAARAVAFAAGAAGASRVSVVNRTPARAERCAMLAGDAGVVAGPEALGDADVVVNATPVGMEDDATPFDVAPLDAGAVLVDLIYGNRETSLVRAARARGLEAHDGTSMLLHQAAVQFTHWTGRDAPLDAMRAALSS